MSPARDELVSLAWDIDQTVDRLYHLSEVFAAIGLDAESDYWNGEAKELQETLTRVRSMVKTA